MNAFKKGQIVEVLFYEGKPALFVGLAIALLVFTNWGVWSLALPLGLLYYAFGIVFLRHKGRKSFKNWLHAYQPTT